MISHQKQNIQFADYAPLVDAEQLLKTAQVKQNLADENIATIKSTVDAYSRLRSYMINDASKNYFDQELKKLTSAIRDSAGLDFSNKGNLANVLAIGRPFENDKYIINGLKAGKEKERRLSELNAMDPSQRSDDNDLVYMMDIYDYIEKGGLDTKVSEGKVYTPYVDMTEEILQMEKEIEAQVTPEVDKLPGGLLDVKQIKEKTKEEVMKRIANLSPQHQAQLNVHTQAEMYRLGNEGMYNAIKEHLSEQIADHEDLANRLRTNIQMARSLPPAQQKAKIAQYNEELRAVDKIITVLNQQYETPSDQFNPNQYIPVFTNKFLGRIAEKAAYTKIDHTIKTDQLGLLAVQNRYQLQKENREMVRESNKQALTRLKGYTNTSGTMWKPGDAPDTLYGMLHAIDPSLLLARIGQTNPTNDKYYEASGIDLAAVELGNQIKQMGDPRNLSEAQKNKLAAMKHNYDLLKEISASLINSLGSVSDYKKKSEDFKFDIGSSTLDQMGKPIGPAILTYDELRNMSVGDLLKLGQFDVYKYIDNPTPTTPTPPVVNPRGGRL